MKDEPQHRHKEAAPTVIHHYEEDETVLERWLRRSLEKGASFWLLIGGAVVLAVVVMLLANSWTSRRSETAQAWLEVMVPSTVPETKSEEAKGLPAEVRPLMKVAEDHPDTPAAHWALYQAACYLYQDGLRDLPNNREAAKPILNQGYELFERVAKAADEDSPLRRLAMMGMARALEARGELSEAREQYQTVVSTWPDSEVASQAKERAAMLEKPEVKKFYEDFYTQDFSRFTSGSGLGTSAGAGLSDGLGLPAGHPPIGTPGLGLPRALPEDLGTEPTGLPTPSQPEPPVNGLPLPELPTESFAPETPTTISPAPEPAPPVSAAEPEARAPSAAPETPGELPSNPFAPGAGAAQAGGSEAPEKTPGELPSDPFATGGGASRTEETPQGL